MLDGMCVLILDASCACGTHAPRNTTKTLGNALRTSQEPMPVASQERPPSASYGGFMVAASQERPPSACYAGLMVVSARVTQSFACVTRQFCLCYAVFCLCYAARQSHRVTQAKDCVTRANHRSLLRMLVFKPSFCGFRTHALS